MLRTIAKLRSGKEVVVRRIIPIKENGIETQEWNSIEFYVPRTFYPLEEHYNDQSPTRTIELKGLKTYSDDMFFRTDYR